jgi:acetylornithine/succinyldiaminopimelate/putrescine aminotransferase
VKKAFMQYGPDIAAVIIEPVAGNMGLIPAEMEFLQTVREVASMYDSILIFDEVITGFRLCYGGIQNLTGITPDLTTWGKLSAAVCRLEHTGQKGNHGPGSPAGRSLPAGTLSGNPLAMAAGIATLKDCKTGMSMTVWRYWAMYWREKSERYLKNTTDFIQSSDWAPCGASFLRKKRFATMNQYSVAILNNMPTSTEIYCIAECICRRHNLKFPSFPEPMI